MRPFRNCLVALACLIGASAGAVSPVVLMGPPGWVPKGAKVALDFANNRSFGCTFASCLSITRASQGTNLLPSSASGATYTTFANNTLRLTPGKGLLIEESRTNQLLNSTAPVTQTTGALAATAQTLWVNGSGSAALSNGTATGCAGTATNGSPVTFTPTAGTCTVTVTGSLNAFQLEAGAFGTSLIVTAGAAAVRLADGINASGNLLTVLTGTGFSISATTSNTGPVGSTRVITGFGITNKATLFYAATGPTLSSAFTGVLNTANNATPSGTNKSAIGTDALGRSLVLNGGTVATDAQTSSFAGSPIQIGSNSNGGFINFLDGNISIIGAWNTRLPDVILKVMTQ